MGGDGLHLINSFHFQVRFHYSLDQEMLISQMFRIKQTKQGPCQKCAESFAGLVDQIIAYGHSTDPKYFTTCFADGLRDDLRPIVTIQRPRDLGTAYTLAILQQKVMEQQKRRDPKKPDGGFHSCPDEFHQDLCHFLFHPGAMIISWFRFQQRNAVCVKSRQLKKSSRHCELTGQPRDSVFAALNLNHNEI